MLNEKARVLIIHDDLTASDPLVISLKEVVGEELVSLERKSSKGLDYILSHLGSKMVVLLDLDLGAGEPDGVKILEQIRQHTALIYVLIITAKEFSSIPPNDFIRIINSDALAIIKSTESTKSIVDQTVRALHKLESRVDAVVETWISKLPEAEKAKPYLSRAGISYSLLDLAKEIRLGTDVGKDIERIITQMAVKMFFDQHHK